MRALKALLRTHFSVAGSLLLAFCSFVAGTQCQAETAPLCFFDASGKSPQQLGLLLNDNECHRIDNGSLHYMDIRSDTDPYNKVQWLFGINENLPQDWKNCVAEVEFLDEGAGVIEAMILESGQFNGTWRLPQRACSYTRLNTSKVRQALFQFHLSGLDLKNSRHPILKISGLQHLIRIQLHRSLEEAAWEKAAASIPTSITPLIQLQHPMELVTTAGVTVIGGSDSIASSLNNIREFAPLARLLGFTSIELYMTWNNIEPRFNEFDFSYYDRLIDAIGRHGLKCFPLLIIGSAYALPTWFINSPDNKEFVCLEHHVSNPIQSIWAPEHRNHVQRVLAAIGKHYDGKGVLEGVRLGPSGNYGESQYPAGGNWGFKGKPMHIHIGYWAGDPDAVISFRNYLEGKYGAIAHLNQAWGEAHPSFESIEPMLPVQYMKPRGRLDMTDWYTRSMTDWCEWWAVETRKAMPATKIYQSSGGWGFREAGTDFSGQTKSMVKIQGGIRMTNETDSLAQNIYINRLAATAARHYQVPIGYEPSSSHTARGVVGRIYNTVITGGDHWFTYHLNLFNHPMAIAQWLENAHWLDQRKQPFVEIAVYYPETMNQLDDSGFRHLYAWGFYPRVAAIRQHIEVDHLDETLIRDGFLSKYKALIFAWGDVIEPDVLEKIDQWCREGGTLIYPSFPKGHLSTVDGDSGIFKAWSNGDTGKGAFHRFRGDMEPPDLYARFVHEVLLNDRDLHPWTQAALKTRHPEQVFFSIREDGQMLAINYLDQNARVTLDGAFDEEIPPFTIRLLPAGK